MGPEVIKLHDVHLVVGRRNYFSGEILLVATSERADFLKDMKLLRGRLSWYLRNFHPS